MDRRQRGPASLGASPNRENWLLLRARGCEVAAVANRDDPTESAATSLFVAATPPLGS